MKRNSVRHTRRILLALVVCATVTTVAAAQTEEQRGEGMYIGDLTGEMKYVLFNRRSDRSALIINGIIIAGEDFLDGEAGWYSSYEGIEISWDPTEPEGEFDLSRESDWGHVVRFQGTYDADGVRGTWTLVYDQDGGLCPGDSRNCTNKSGTFDIARTSDSGGGTGSSLCGATGSASAAALAVGLLSMSTLARRRRRR